MMSIMCRITSLALTVILAANINAYPQEVEFLPSNVPRKPPVDLHYAASGRSFIPPPDFFVRMPKNYYYPPFQPARFIPPFPFYPVGRHPVVAPRIPFPDISKLPDNYSNSTREVKTANGQKVVVSQKIHKSKDGNGFFVSRLQTFHSVPDEEVNSAPDNKAYPTADDTVRSTPDQKAYPPDDVEILSNPDSEYHNRNSFNDDVPLVRRRRNVIGGLMQQLFDLIFKAQEAPVKTLKKNERLEVASLPAEDLIISSNQVSSKESNKPILISLENDTRINFGKPINKLNDDAEFIKTKNLIKAKNIKSKSK